MDKRIVLRALTALPLAGTLYTQKTFACSMGMSLYYVEGFPDGYRASKADNVSEVVSNYLGRSDWVYASNECRIESPPLAENAAVVPMRIVMPCSASGEALFDKAVVVAEKLIDVLMNRSRPVEVPNRDGHVPLNFEPKTRNTAAVFFKVATYQLGDYAVPEITMRLNLSGASKVRMLALLEPNDRSKPVQVIRQQEATVIWSCDKTIYTDGPTPAGSERGFYYF